MGPTDYTVPVDGQPWSHTEIETNGITLHAVTAGPEDGPLVVCLHGFPEFWYAWHHQIPALADAGYRVVAPDMRGYNCSEKPDGVSSYRIEALVSDVVGLVRALGRERATIVGHDWGGLVAWQTAIDRPEIVDRLVVLNAPHPSAYERALRTSPEQMYKSWYVAAFQLPVIPELVLGWNDFAIIDRLCTSGTVRSDAFSERDMQFYKRALSRPGARTAALNYYRAMARRNAWQIMTQGGVGDLPVRVPTLLLWGEQDSALDISLTEGLEQWVPDIRVDRIADASHWVQFDAPERVSESVVAYLDG